GHVWLGIDLPEAVLVGDRRVVGNAVLVRIDEDGRARLRRAGDELAVGEVDHWRSRRDRVHHLFGGFRPVAVFHGRNGKFGSVRQVRVWIDAPIAVLVHHRGVFRAGLAVSIDLDDRSGLAGAGDGLAVGGVDVRRFRREV